VIEDGPAKQLKELEKDNGKLTGLMAELSLDKQLLMDIAEGKPGATSVRRGACP
jgi:hypothetical protein